MPQIAGEKDLGDRHPDLATALREAHAVALQAAGKPGHGFGERLRLVVRDEPKAFAYDLGLTLSAVYNYMNGRIPTTDVLFRISLYTGHSIEWFLEGDADEVVD